MIAAPYGTRYDSGGFLGGGAVGYLNKYALFVGSSSKFDDTTLSKISALISYTKDSGLCTAGNTRAESTANSENTSVVGFINYINTNLRLSIELVSDSGLYLNRFILEELIQEEVSATMQAVDQ